MQALIIKDLETSKELTGKELSAVRGGFIAALLGGQAVTGGVGIFNTTLANQYADRDARWKSLP